VEVLTLVDRARAAGLDVRADDGLLVVTGPRSAEALAAELGRHKAAVLAALNGVEAENWVNAWAAQGALSGHEWLGCSICGEIQLLAPDRAGRPCHLTAGCTGTVRRQCP